jgi:hypothetical protein
MGRVEGLMLAWARGLPPEAVHDSLLDATPDEKLLARHIAQEMAKGFQGVGALPPQKTADDLTMRELQALATVWAWLRRWSVSFRDDYRLGDAFKVLDPQEVAQARRILAWGAAQSTRAVMMPLIRELVTTCVCTSDRPCLAHYAELPSNGRRMARRRPGIDLGSNDEIDRKPASTQRTSGGGKRRTIREMS